MGEAGRGQLYHSHDSAGALTAEAFDFKGNLHARRARQHKAPRYAHGEDERLWTGNDLRRYAVSSTPNLYEASSDTSDNTLMSKQHKHQGKRAISRLLQSVRGIFRTTAVGYDSHNPPPEEHSFVLQNGDSLAVITFSAHGYTGWFALRNGSLGATEVEHKGLGHWNLPHRSTINHRLPIEEALNWVKSSHYNPSSRADFARIGYLTLTGRVDRSDQQVIEFFRSSEITADNPVNTLIDEVDRSCENLLLMKRS